MLIGTVFANPVTYQLAINGYGTDSTEMCEIIFGAWVDMNMNGISSKFAWNK